MEQADLAFLDGPWRLAMGLRRLELTDWLRVDAAHAHQMRLRDRLLHERRDEVAAALPESAAGAAETLALLTAFLPQRFAERWVLQDGVMIDRVDGRQIDLASDAPLVAAGRLVQEDLCLMRPGPDGYYLAAAVLCFPSHWRLHEKLGRPMAVIHGPVPGFAERLGAPVDRFMTTLSVERPVWRVNWSIAENDELFSPDDRAAHRPATGRTVADALFLRVERQTLRRLPHSGDVLFTIHTAVSPLTEAIGCPRRARALGARIREMPGGMARYKGFDVLGVPLLTWLDRRAGCLPG